MEGIEQPEADATITSETSSEAVSDAHEVVAPTTVADPTRGQNAVIDRVGNSWVMVSCCGYVDCNLSVLVLMLLCSRSVHSRTKKQQSLRNKRPTASQQLRRKHELTIKLLYVIPSQDSSNSAIY